MSILRDLRPTANVSVYAHDDGTIGLTIRGGVRVDYSLSPADARAIGNALIEAADVAERKAP